MLVSTLYMLEMKDILVPLGKSHQYMVFRQNRFIVFPKNYQTSIRKGTLNVKIHIC